MLKKFHRRGPDGRRHEFFVAEDLWQPLPGQHVVFDDVLVGAGRARVTEVCPVYGGSAGINEIAQLIGRRSDEVHLRYLDVYCEEDAEPDQYTRSQRYPRPAAALADTVTLPKTFLRRGPDGHMKEFHTADDVWQPIPGQDIAFTDVLHGAGWVTIAAVRPTYAGSLAHTEMAKLVAGEPNHVQLRGIEVFCEEKRLPE